MRRCARGLIILLSLLAVAMATADTPAARQELRAAMRLGLDWIRQHPAGPADGGLADMIDEGVSLRVFQALAPDPAQGAEFESLFRDRMAGLERLSQFRQWVERPHKTLIEHYHLVLAAWLMQQAGTHSPLTASIARQAQQAVSTATHEHPTVRLTTALFLGRLQQGAQPDLRPLLAHSLTAQLGRNRQLIELPAADGTAAQGRAATWLLYALLHEVVAATDFGRLAPPSWLSARRDTLTAVLQQAVPWAGSQRNWDLAAELLMALYFLGGPLTPEMRTALDQLLRNQQPDGSWGASPTSARSNRVRHTVLTATAALMAWSNRGDDRNPENIPPPAPAADDGRPPPGGAIDPTQGFWRAPWLGRTAAVETRRPLPAQASVPPGPARSAMVPTDAGAHPLQGSAPAPWQIENRFVSAGRVQRVGPVGAAGQPYIDTCGQPPISSRPSPATAPAPGVRS